MEDIFIENHEQYLTLLKKLKDRTAYIVIVQVFRDKKDKLINHADSTMRLLEEKLADEWPGTKTYGGKNLQKVYAANDEFFDYLESFSSFFFSHIGKNEEFIVERTEFGVNDIAFYDIRKRCLFFTTTHEGYASLHENLLGDTWSGDKWDDPATYSRRHLDD